MDQWGDTAVSSFRWEIGYTMDNRRFDEVGRELWVWIGRDGNWVAVWRAQCPVQGDVLPESE